MNYHAKRESFAVLAFEHLETFSDLTLLNGTKSNIFENVHVISRDNGI